MILRKSKFLWVLLVCITLLAAGCGKTSTTIAPESTGSTSNSQKLTEPSNASNGSSTAAPSPTQSTPTSIQVIGTLQVHYIDVGQADSILIKGGCVVMGQKRQ